MEGFINLASIRDMYQSDEDKASEFLGVLLSSQASTVTTCFYEKLRQPNGVDFAEQHFPRRLVTRLFMDEKVWHLSLHCCV